MTDVADNAAVDVRAEDAFDLDAVDAELKAAIPDLRGHPTLKQFPSGASNLTYLLSYPDRALVLRRPPRGAKPKSGHSMIREFTVMKAIKPAFGAVPECLYYADDERSVIGAEFYVMDKVDGALVTSQFPPQWGWGPDDNREFCARFWDKLIELHALDYDALGLSDFGNPNGYVERQILGWNARYEKALTADADPFEDVRQWLADNRPATESDRAILHGDYRIDNLILGHEPPHEIRAVLDWEISALGDPLMDLGAALAYWIEVDDPPALQVLKKQPSDAPGMFTRREVVDYYAQKTGRAVDDFTFYFAYGLFRLAVISQQIYYRYYHKQTTNPAYAVFGEGGQNLGRYVRDMIRERS